jgi:signal transduction histidine kinase
VSFASAYAACAPPSSKDGSVTHEDGTISIRLRHDLKGPLTVIAGYAELLGLRNDEEMRLEASRMILDAVMQMRSSIDEIAEELD